MTDKATYLGRAADRLMDLDNASYGDERERAVFMEASTFGTTIGTYLHLLGAVVAAALGQLLLPVVLVVLMGVPALATGWYASRRGVDISELAARAGTRTKALHIAIVFGALLLVLGAMLFTVSTGHGLVPVPEPDLLDPETRELLSSMVGGACVGGVIGGAGAGGWFLWKSRRRATAATEDDQG
ncbi:hypothetical protein FE374_16465 [Georgenia yuyongxinii]|uniref:Uncharacterized protein n=1 Tax=Georgenia yuyongxinii TaxID=2589797 RepID=A0A5B8C904_9MICO|nr:hypothetical protein [Georgenia yuyongxinii]QDC26001.1 hypothetical protein FE374_16465 [Georgenia yuyongxinii]